MKVSIILVNYKTLECIIECIKSIKATKFNNLEIIVVDNDSKDNCRSMIMKLWDDIVVIENSSNMGFSEANNIGIKHAIKNSTEYILLLNGDTIVSESFFDTLLSTRSNIEEDRIGIISAKILYYDNPKKIWYNGGRINKLKGSADIYDLNLKNYESKQKVMECTFISGCCMLIPARVINDVGLLCDKYFLYYEDTDYCYKISKAGYKLIINRMAIMYHKESASTGKKSNLYTYYNTRNRFIFANDNLTGVYKWFSFMYTFGWLIKKIVYKEYKIKYVILGCLDFLKNRNGKTERNM